MKRAVFLASMLLLAPAPVLAQVAATGKVLGLFNIFVGLLLTVSILTYAVGFGMWATRLGTWPTYRTEAIKIMEWAVAQLFVLIVLLAIVQFFQRNPVAASYTISVVVAIAIIWMIIKVSSGGGEKKEGEH